jgi:hexulose-6-phosphate isomerase
VEVALDMDGELGMASGPTQWQSIKQSAKDADVNLYSVASGLYWEYAYTSADRQKRETAMAITRKQLEAAAYLGCDTVLVIPGVVGVDFIPNSEIVDYRTAYQRAGEALTELAADAEKTGVCIGLENVWNKFLTSPLEMNRFIEEINSPYVAAYFDVGNTVLNGYPEHWIHILGSKIKKVHFKDYRRAAGGIHGFVDLLAGDVDYPSVMKALNDVGYDGWVTAEMIPAYTHYTDQIIFSTSLAMDRILSDKRITSC